MTEIKCAGTGVDSTFIGKCLSWEVVIQDDTIRAKLVNCIELENCDAKHQEQIYLKLLS